MNVRLDARQALAAGATAATVLLTAAAFWLSYEHLHAVAMGNGMAGVQAWAWPATIDLFVVVGELLLLRSLLAGRGVDWWAVGLTLIGSAGSIALNVAGVGASAPLLGYVVAAVPPVAALFAFAALMRQVHERLSAPAQAPAEALLVPAVPAPVPLAEKAVPVAIERAPEVDFVEVIHEVPAESSGVVQSLAPPEPVPPGVRLLPIVARPELPSGTDNDLPGHDDRAAPVPVQAVAAEPFTRDAATPGDRSMARDDAQYAPVPRSEGSVLAVPLAGTGEVEAVPDDGTAGLFEQRVGLVREWLRENPELTGTAIAAKFGTGDSYGRRLRRAAVAA